MSCFGGRDEQIYLVELTVERLRLAADKFREEFVDCPPVVKLKFIDFPVFVITHQRRRSDNEEQQQQQQSSSQELYDEIAGLLYGCGKSCLFVRKPRDLVTAMQSQPLRVGVFRGDETFPIAEATVPLSGCLCDQVAMVANDEEHRPRPYVLAGCFNLVDPGKNPAGNIRLHFRLTFFGSYIISHYQLYPESCIFKNDFDGEYRVTKVINEKESEEDSEEKEPAKFKISEGTVLAAMRSEPTAKNTTDKSK